MLRNGTERFGRLTNEECGVQKEGGGWNKGADHSTTEGGAHRKIVERLGRGQRSVMVRKKVRRGGEKKGLKSSSGNGKISPGGSRLGSRKQKRKEKVTSWLG